MLTPEQQQLVEDNMGLARYMAPKMHRHRQQMEYEDVLADCMVGLVKAAQKYDPTRGVAFSTYATTIIHNTFLKGHRRKEILTLSLNSLSIEMKSDTWERLFANNDEPIDEHVSDRLLAQDIWENPEKYNVTPTQHVTLRAMRDNPWMPVAEINRLLGVCRTSAGSQLKRVRRNVLSQLTG